VQHFYRINGADDVLVKRQPVVVGGRGVPVGDVIDERVREHHGGQTQADGHQVRGHEAHADHHDAVNEHAQYAAGGHRAADHAVLDCPPFVRRGVGHVRIDAVEQRRRAASDGERDRLHGGSERGRHGPADGAVHRQQVRRDLAGDR